MKTDINYKQLCKIEQELYNLGKATEKLREMVEVLMVVMERKQNKVSKA